MHAMRRNPGARRALTLIEVLIVIAILLAIGGLVVVNLIPRKEQADVDLTRSQIQSFENALNLFKLDMKRFPTEDEGLRALWTRDAIEDETEAESWTDPYLTSPRPRDAWGGEWIYRNPSEHEIFEYDIVSMGPDGEEDTADDISNHDDAFGADGELSEEFEDFSVPEPANGSTP